MPDRELEMFGGPARILLCPGYRPTEGREPGANGPARTRAFQGRCCAVVTAGVRLAYVSPDRVQSPDRLAREHCLESNQSGIGKSVRKCSRGQHRPLDRLKLRSPASEQ